MVILGKVRLRDFMNNEGLEKFSESVGTYTGLSKQEAEQFLEITVHLDKFRQVKLQIIIMIASSRARYMFDLMLIDKYVWMSHFLGKY